MDAKQIAHGILDGISTIPSGMYHGVVRTWQGAGLAGSSLKTRNQEETERFARMVKSMGNSEEPLRRLITIVITDFYQKLDASGKESINNKLAYGAGRLGGRTGGQFALAQFAAHMMLRKATSALAYKQFVRFGASFTLNLVMLQGLIEEAAQASRRMQVKFPQTYQKVSALNLDMAYFLVEAQLEPYLQFINSHPMLCKGIQNELCKILSNQKTH
ncbi:TPA: hypothetical protein ACQVHP_004162 [Serratia marcescens]|nr:hypothetical protein [Serratia marcescens]